MSVLLRGCLAINAAWRALLEKYGLLILLRWVGWRRGLKSLLLWVSNSKRDWTSVEVDGRSAHLRWEGAETKAWLASFQCGCPTWCAVGQAEEGGRGLSRPLAGKWRRDWDVVKVESGGY